jgi:hypothetical protein
MDLESVKHTVKLSSDWQGGCAFCGQNLGVSMDWDINHLLQSHGGVLLHVGTESTNTVDEPAYYMSVALVGFAELPQPKESSARFSTQLPPASKP